MDIHIVSTPGKVKNDIASSSSFLVFWDFFGRGWQIWSFSPSWVFWANSLMPGANSKLPGMFTL